MKVAAPGKLLLTGSYAVLEGAPAIAVGIDRVAVADDEGDPDSVPPREVREAFGDAPAPAVDVSALQEAGLKLGLGSSAAGLVAALGLRAARDGADLRAPAVLRALFDEARRVHARAQGGGSGVDVAVAVFGGAIRYRLDGAHAEVCPIELPRGLVLRVLWSGASARTSDMLARVNALKASDPTRYQACMTALRDAATRAVGAVQDGSVAALVRAAQRASSAMGSLGAAAKVPIVTEEFGEIAKMAMLERAAFLPSGAGGGDVGVYLGDSPPSAALLARAEELELVPIDVAVHPSGVSRIG